MGDAARASLHGAGSRRGDRVFVWLPGAGVLVGAWTIVAMNVFPTLTERWLAFASGLGIVGLVLLALTLQPSP